MPTMNLFKKILDNHPEALWLTDAVNFDIEYFNNYKENLIKKKANEYKNKIPKKLYDAMYNYKVEITD